MLGEALDFPASGDEGSTALLVGGALLLVGAVFLVIGVILVPLLAVTLLCWLAVRGYYVRVLRRSAVDPDADAPGFGNWRDLLGDGLVSLLISLVYLLPFLALIGLAVGGGGFVSSVEDPSAGFDAVRNAMGLVLMVALLYFIVMSYVVPAAVTNFAHEGEFRAAFRLRTVLDGAFSEDYAVGWLLTVVVRLIVLPIAFTFTFLLVGFFMGFFVGVAVRYVLGRSFGAAMGFEPEPSAVERGTPTVRARAPGDTRSTVGPAGGTGAAENPGDGPPDGDRGPRSSDDDAPRPPSDDPGVFDVDDPSDDRADDSSSDSADDGDDDPLAGEFGR